MKRQLTTFAFAGFLGICCIGCPPADQEPADVDTDTDIELLNDDIDAGAPPVDEDSNTTAAGDEVPGIEFPTEDEHSNTTAADGETTGIEFPTEEELPEDEEVIEVEVSEEEPEDEE